ncbi:DUF4858 domain-containing protein [Bacteroides sp.]
MTKRFIFFLLISLSIPVAYSQEWTKEDSLNLSRILKADGEMKLNPEAVKQIDFGSDIMGTPLMSTEKSWMLPDESLPSSLPNTLPLEKRQMLSLHPYKTNTPYDWDPVYQKKIKVGRDTWRGDPFYRIKTFRGYTNTSKAPLRVMVMEQPSLTDIEAITLQYKPLYGQANGSMPGVAIGGFDFMYVFTKDFWDKRGRERRARTLEVLKTYGDSTTVLLPVPVLQSVIR